MITDVKGLVDQSHVGKVVILLETSVSPAYSVKVFGFSLIDVLIRLAGILI